MLIAGSVKEKNIEFYSFRHLYKTMLQRSRVKEDIIEYFMGHSVNVRNMSENYNNREDLDDVFFEENGLKVIEYVNGLCEEVIRKYELLPNHTHIKEIYLTDNKGNLRTYYTEVLKNLDFEDETFLFIDSLINQNLLPETDNANELISGLKQLLDMGKIDKRRYEDCVEHIQNSEEN